LLGLHDESVAPQNELSTLKMNVDLKKLRELEQKSKRLRKKLGIGNPGEVIFQAPQSTWSDNDVVVEADGIGGAKLLVVEGNYPIDYSVKFERQFATEDEACDAAEKKAH
jgi:hypothetical protein